MKQNKLTYDIYEKYEDLNYEFNEDEFEELKYITEEQIEKHEKKEDKERILMEFCHMGLRNGLLNTLQVLNLFYAFFGMSAASLCKKYYVNSDSMYLINQKEDKFIKIKRGGKFK